jgi:Fe2+ or Zn2+ uptake regulation protein
MTTDHEIEDKAQSLTDFQIKRHSLEFIGVCPECREAKGRRVA